MEVISNYSMIQISILLDISMLLLKKLPVLRITFQVNGGMGKGCDILSADLTLLRLLPYLATRPRLI